MSQAQPALLEAGRGACSLAVASARRTVLPFANVAGNTDVAAVAGTTLP
jgi:hypothetical protein